MRANRILKHAELYLLRDAELWRNEPKTWADAQELLRGIRLRLSKVRRNRILTGKVVLASVCWYLALANCSVAGTLPDSPGTVRGQIVETYSQDERMIVHNVPSQVQTDKQPRIFDWSFVVGHAIYGVSNAFDNYETQKNLYTCAFEGNPDLGRTPTVKAQAIHGAVEFGAVVAGDALLKWFGRRQGVPKWLNMLGGNGAAMFGTVGHARAGMRWVRLCN